MPQYFGCYILEIFQYLLIDLRDIDDLWDDLLSINYMRDCNYVSQSYRLYTMVFRSSKRRFFYGILGII